MATYTLPSSGDTGWDDELAEALDAINSDVESRSDDTTVVHLDGDESISGEKTFVDGIVVPDESIPSTAIAGLGAELDAAGTVKTINSVEADPTSGDVALTMDDVPDGTTRLGYSTDERDYVLDRANHTGTQEAFTIVDFDSAARIAAKTGILAGSGVVVTPGAGETVTVSASVPPPGSGYARTTYPYVTASLTAGSQETGTIPVGAEYVLSKIQTSAACRVRIYTTAAKRTADASRGATLPTGDVGLVFEYTAIGAESFDIAPSIVGDNFEDPVNAPILIDNTGGSTATITVTFTYKRME